MATKVSGFSADQAQRIRKLEAALREALQWCETDLDCVYDGSPDPDMLEARIELLRGALGMVSFKSLKGA
jgi:hypothetical protein